MFLKGSWWVILRDHGEAYLRHPGTGFSGAWAMFRHTISESNAVLPFNKILAIVHLTYVRYSATGPGGPLGAVLYGLPCSREAPAAFFFILLVFMVRILRLSSFIFQQIEYFT